MLQAKAEADHKEAQKELEELEQVLNMRAEEGAKLQQELEALRVQLKVRDHFDQNPDLGY
jgi:regulator of replication initiation timing